MRLQKRILFLVLALLVSFVPSVLQAGRIDKKMAATVEKARREMKPLNLGSAQEYPNSVKEYFSFYGLDVGGPNHFFGNIDSGKYSISVHVFKVPDSKATVLIAHGYYDHAGVWQHVIAHLVEKGFTVVVYDQPGHGLSSGARASIDDFARYREVLEDIIGYCGKNLPGPYYLAAHSTGCSATMDHILGGKKTPLEKIVMISPLIRSVAWQAAGFGHKLGGQVLDYVPRAFRRNSSDREFLKFMKRDPLQARKVPTDWVEAHRNWVARIEAAGSSEKHVKILQGDKDTTVDWKHNLGVIKKKLPNADVSMIKGGGHQLINESVGMREETLKLISDWFLAK